MKKILIFGFAVLLTGCGTAGDVTSGDIGVRPVEIDGETVNCVVWDSSHAGGLQCDFD